jgi:leucyl aminopeptidase
MKGAILKSTGEKNSQKPSNGFFIINNTMTFTYSKNLNPHSDLILPCKKADLEKTFNDLDIKNPDFEAEFGTYLTHYTNNGRKIYVLGIGEDKHSSKIEEAFRTLTFETKKYWSNTIEIDVNGLSKAEILKASIGVKLADYKIGSQKSEQEEFKDLEVCFIHDEDVSGLVNEGYETADTINKIKAIVDAPPNIKTPEYLGAWAKASAKKYNYSCDVLDEAELEKQGFKALLSVGQASVNKSVAIVTQYKGKDTDAIDFALVGKGITFDSGGLSIKPSTNLHYMKSDMGGASVVLGVVELVAKLKLNINIVGVVVSAENAVGSNAYRPGDVIGSHSGKTIEIIDTDAEGRLALADGISYVIDNYKPEYLLDVATLTGSVVRTFGYSAAGLFTNNDDIAEAMETSGYKVHERIWRLPMFEDYEEDLQSDVADIRNFSGKPIAGAINAAKFLEAFTKDHKKWMHLDIAGVAFGSSKYAKMKSASGYGIQLLTTFVKDFFKA